MEESRLKTYSPNTFAFLGDAVCTLYMREYVVKKANMGAGKLHRETVKLVSANAQEKAILSIIEEGLLSEEELSIYKRGENVRTESHAKNASDTSYHRATGFECLLGWLYLKEEHERIAELIGKAIEVNMQVS